MVLTVANTKPSQEPQIKEDCQVVSNSDKQSHQARNGSIYHTSKTSEEKPSANFEVMGIPSITTLQDFLEMHIG